MLYNLCKNILNVKNFHKSFDLAIFAQICKSFAQSHPQDEHGSTASQSKIGEAFEPKIPIARTIPSYALRLTPGRVSARMGKLHWHSATPHLVRFEESETIATPTVTSLLCISLILQYLDYLATPQGGCQPASQPGPSLLWLIVGASRKVLCALTSSYS